MQKCVPETSGKAGLTGRLGGLSHSAWHKEELRRSFERSPRKGRWECAWCLSNGCAVQDTL